MCTQCLYESIVLWAAWLKGIYPYRLTYMVHKDLLLVGFISQNNQDVLGDIRQVSTVKWGKWRANLIEHLFKEMDKL